MRSTLAGLESILAAQRAAHAADPNPDARQRLDRLHRLATMTEQHGAELVQAIQADFGHRSAHETRLTDLLMVGTAIRHAARHLPTWMKTRRAKTALHYLPGRNRLMRQPLGVVGILSPWNYPYQLAMGPAIAAIAAGNRVMIKPSEYTPRFSALLVRIVAAHFAPEELAVVTGGLEVGQAFSALPFDHLFFTGSTAAGRQVAMAAAHNLTAVTLELGGKSPAIIDPSANLTAAARSIVFGKLLNAGQTCIAPDYVLVPHAQRDAFVHALSRAARQMYGESGANPDYTAIISERHFSRLQTLVDDALAQGATAQRPTFCATPDDAPTGHARKFPPTLLLDVRPDMRVMQEEIFGPVLPIVSYSGDVDEAIAFVNERDRPLALYWYGTHTSHRDRVLERTVSGGVTVNDCIWHFGQESQPFGGVGASGMGAYHGEWGFRTFSKEKPVFLQAPVNGIGLLYPPYGKTFERMVRMLKAIA
ncbi:coniferyl aldehyde dehydrogenase [Burkholderia sp. Ac-20353]|uniref:coniferyl aldehyde dehydrogenase n=1 Tax=Burkholderia sp. Ac-20353 TaxID=2703894 RepID=UPI00197C6E54|nr:coniferyl aldehyde dehydrogenase [Burkholderia sp. Ac-20353]MBN3786972.1 coniferyl aldehyde dehydrogenase [Burkholderia sp. Ac-20353]